MSKCDIKTSAKAWNDGLDAFKKAHKQTGGKVRPSVRFAINEIHAKNPDVDFDVDTFVNPLIDSLKEKGLIKDSFKFNQESSQDLKSKAEKLVDKLKGIPADKKKDFARKSFKQIVENGGLDQEGVMSLYAEALGLPTMTAAVREQIKLTSKALKESNVVDSDINKVIKEIQAKKTEQGGKLTPEQDANFTKQLSILAESRNRTRSSVLKETQNFSQHLADEKFWLHQLADYMPLNLMNPNSLAKNVSGAFVDAYIRSVGNTIAPVISKLLSLVTGIDSNPFGARVRGAISKSNIRAKAKEAWSYGKTEFNNELPSPDHLRAVASFRRAMDSHGTEKFKNMISATLKVHPAIISKGLTVPDVIAFEMVKAGELNRIAEAKNLKGAEKEAFMMQPDEKSNDIALKAAKDVTFKKDLPDNKFFGLIKDISSYDANERAKKLVSEKNWSPLSAKLYTGSAAIVLKSTMPFVKTPINMIRTATKMLLPEIALGDALLKAKKETDVIERQKLVVDGVSRFVAGMVLRNVALELLAQGLMSAGYSDEEPKVKDLVEQNMGGPNRVNINALMRGLTMREIKQNKGDKYVDYSSLGALGLTLASYSHAYSKMSNEDREIRTQYSKDLSNIFSMPAGLAVSSLSSGLDFTFFTGVNQLKNAISNEKGFEMNKWGVDIASNVFTGFLPSTYQKLSTQYDPNVKKQFDVDKGFTENLSYALGYRFLFQSKKLKDKYYSLAEEKGGGVKKKRHMLFDNYLGRVMEAEFDFLKMTEASEDTPIHFLYNESRKVSKEDRDKLMPNSVSDEISVPYKKRGKSGKSINTSIKIKLTQEQHEYLQEQASNYRMMLSSPFVVGQEFTELSFEQKTGILQSFYNDGLKMATKDLKSKYPDLKKQAIDVPDKGEKVKLKKKYKVDQSNK